MTINPQADELVTRVLIGLRDTEAPRGLENRIAARIAARQAQAAEARSNAPRIPFAGFWLYATAATVLAVLSLIGVSLRHQPQTTANVASTQVPQGFRLGSHSSAKEEGASAPAPAKTQAVQGFSPHISQGPTKTLVPQGFSLGSHNPAKEGGVLTPLVDDPDTIALAETLAPSRPAPCPSRPRSSSSSPPRAAASPSKSRSSTSSAPQPFAPPPKPASAPTSASSPRVSSAPSPPPKPSTQTLHPTPETKRSEAPQEQLKEHLSVTKPTSRAL